MQFFPTSEGYVNCTTAASIMYYNYVYNYTDHLGNIRMSYTWDEEIQVLSVLEEHHYYPFGLEHSGYISAKKQFEAKLVEVTLPEGGKISIFKPRVIQVVNSGYQYQYNGKEYQDELGLNVYDYGNRNYDAAIGRFFTMDRFSEKYFDKSNYSYAGNNPSLFIDVQGDSIAIYSKRDATSIKYYNGNLYQYSTTTNRYENYQGKNYKVDKNGNVKIKGDLGRITKALDKIRNGGESGKDLVNTLQNCSQSIIISESTNNNNTYNVDGSSSIKFNPNNGDGGYDEKGSTNRPAYIGLAHELGHSLDNLDGNMDRTVIGTIEGRSIFAMEYFAMHWENRIRGENGILLRSYYSVNERNTKIGLNLNADGTSLNYTKQIVVPTILMSKSSRPFIINQNLTIPYPYR